MSLVSLDSTNTSHEIFSSQESLYQGAARACCPARAGDPEAEHDNKAGRGLTDKGPTAPKQGEQSRSGEGNQLQPRVKSTSQVLGNETSPRSSWTAESAFQGCDQNQRQDLGQMQGQCLQLSPQSAEVKPGSQTTGHG